MYGILLDELKKVFEVFCFTGEITQKDENTFVLTLECYDEDLTRLDKEFVFQNVMTGFTKVHNNDVLEKFNRIELDYDKFCKEGFIVTEKHLEGYTPTNWEFHF